MHWTDGKARHLEDIHPRPGLQSDRELLLDIATTMPARTLFEEHCWTLWQDERPVLICGYTQAAPLEVEAWSIPDEKYVAEHTVSVMRATRRKLADVMKADGLPIVTSHCSMWDHRTKEWLLGLGFWLSGMRGSDEFRYVRTAPCHSQA